MRNTTWLRYGLASIIVAGTALGATLVACGDDDSSSSSGGTPDTGTGDTSTGGDTGTGVDAADAAKPKPAKLTFVNALTDLGPVADVALNGRGDAMIRVCFKQGTTDQNLSVAPYPPLPDKAAFPLPTAGIPYAAGGTFPSFGLDLEPRIIVPIVMNVKTLEAKGIKNPGNGQPGTTCDELVGDTKDAAIGLVENKDYWILPAIPAGSFKAEKSYVLALTGCAGNSVRSPGVECGPGFVAGGPPGVGNMKVTFFETNTVPVSATQLGAQWFHVSAQLNSSFAAGGPVDFKPGFTADPADAAAFKPAVASAIELYKLSPVMGVTGVKDSDILALNLGGPPLGMPLPIVQVQSGLGPPVAPTVYKDGKNYVFISIGDPKEPLFSSTVDGGEGDGGDGTVPNPKSFHFLGFPTDPVIEPYKP